MLFLAKRASQFGTILADPPLNDAIGVVSVATNELARMPAFGDIVQTDDAATAFLDHHISGKASLYLHWRPMPRPWLKLQGADPSYKPGDDNLPCEMEVPLKPVDPPAPPGPCKTESSNADKYPYCANNSHCLICRQQATH